MIVYFIRKYRVILSTYNKYPEIHKNIGLRDIIVRFQDQKMLKFREKKFHSTYKIINFFFQIINQTSSGNKKKR